jgi:hypothetical protein
MKKYKVISTVLWYETCMVLANNENEAKSKVLDGDYVTMEDGEFDEETQQVVSVEEV